MKEKEKKTNNKENKEAEKGSLGEDLLIIFVGVISLLSTIGLFYYPTGEGEWNSFDLVTNITCSVDDVDAPTICKVEIGFYSLCLRTSSFSLSLFDPLCQKYEQKLASTSEFLQYCTLEQGLSMKASSGTSVRITKDIFEPCSIPELKKDAERDTSED